MPSNLLLATTGLPVVDGAGFVNVVVLDVAVVVTVAVLLRVVVDMAVDAGMLLVPITMLGAPLVET
jgi:hypothetical protein